MTISPCMSVFPGSPAPTFVSWAKFGIHGYDSEAIFMSTHTGTHVDAPSHFAPKMASIDKISPRRFVSSALLIKISKRANQLIEVEDIRHKDEAISEDDTLLFMTGWEKRASSKNYMTENPGLSADTAKYIVSKKVNAVAIDGPSIDAGFDNRFPAHNILLPANILAVENLCNVNKIPKERFTLAICPLKIRNATGSPIRAVAII